MILKMLSEVILVGCYQPIMFSQDSEQSTMSCIKLCSIVVADEQHAIYITSQKGVQPNFGKNFVKC